MRGTRRRLLSFGYIVLTIMISMISGFSCGGDGNRSSSESTELVVLFSSDLLGLIRSCGCAVADNGGLGRRATYIEEIRERYPNLIVLDAGDAMSLELSYSQKEADLTWDAFTLMETDAFTPGEIDFIYGLPYLKRVIERTGLEMIALNIVDPETEPLGETSMETVEATCCAANLRLGQV